MNAAGMFVEEDSSKPDAWKNASKSYKLIKKYGGDIFSETRLDDGLHSRTSPPRKRIWPSNRDLSAAWPTWPCRVWRTSPPSTCDTKHTPFIYSVAMEL